MNSYLAGSLVTVATWSGTVNAPAGGFRDTTGNLADPTTVTLRYRAPGVLPVTTVTYPAAPIVKDGVGLYHADLDTTGSAAGTWGYEWLGTGTVQAAAGAEFQVTVAFQP